MTVTVRLPTQLRDATGGSGEVSVPVDVYVDGEDIRFGDGVDTIVPDGGEIQILPAVAGG
jgi:molybdopterin synthase sulfur carrier subunit